MGASTRLSNLFCKISSKVAHQYIYKPQHLQLYLDLAELKKVNHSASINAAFILLRPRSKNHDLSQKKRALILSANTSITIATLLEAALKAGVGA